jgi:DNA-binding response OmpR family regulator
MAVGTKHVLVIEDDEAFTYAVAKYLTHRGLRVTVAHSGIDGLHANDRDPADLVLLDMRLPDMHGTAVALDLRSQRPNLPIVGLTGFVYESRSATLALTLSKPVELEDLHHQILTVLARNPTSH